MCTGLADKVRRLPAPRQHQPKFLAATPELAKDIEDHLVKGVIYDLAITEHQEARPTHIEPHGKEVEGAKSLLQHQAKSIVLARPGGKIMHGTEGGMAVLQRLRSLSSLPQDKQEAMLPSVLRNAIEREARHIVVADLRVHFCELAMTEVTTATELISIQFSRELKKQPQAKASVSLGDLTPAEQRVLPLLMEGLRNKEIADRLNISVHTVKHHVSAILAKARCSDRLLLVAKANHSMEDPEVKKLFVAPLPEGDFLPPSMTQPKTTRLA